MRVSILIVVSAVIILIIAVILVTMFTGGIERFNWIWGGFSDEQLLTSACKTDCSNLCFSTGTKTGPPPGYGKVKIGGAERNCNIPCNCAQYFPSSPTPTTTGKNINMECNPLTPNDCAAGLKCDTTQTPPRCINA